MTNSLGWPLRRNNRSLSSPRRISESRPKKMPASFSVNALKPGKGSALGVSAGGQAKWSGVMPRLNKYSLTFANAASLKRTSYWLPRYCTVSNVALRRRAHVNNLPVFVRVEPAILELNIAQKHDYDFLAEIFGFSHLGQTFGRFKRIGGGEQQDRLATRVGFPQSVFPALACSDVFRSRKISSFRPVVRTEPLFECNGRNVVFARMTDKEPGQGSRSHCSRRRANIDLQLQRLQYVAFRPTRGGHGFVSADTRAENP